MPEDISLKFVLDEAAMKRVESRVSTLAQELEKLGVTTEQIKGAKFGNEVAKEADAAAKAVKEKLNPALVDTKDIIKQSRNEARLLRAQAATIVDDLEKMRVARIKAFGDRLGSISRAGLVAGAGFVGGALAEAGHFAKDAEDAGRATQATRDWTKATDELARARSRVDQVLLKETLPLLEQAAKVASQAANVIEKNPVIVRAALETGKIVAGLSVLGILASKGIALYADAKAVLFGTQEMAAAKLQEDAANKQLRAALLQAGKGDVGIPTKAGPGGLLSGLSSPAGIATVIVATATASAVAADQLKKLEEALVKLGGPAVEPFFGLLDTVLQTIDPLVPAIKNMRTSLERDIPLIQKAIEKLTGTQPGAGGTIGVSSVASLGGDLATSSHRDQIAEAWQKWQADDARIVQEAAERRVDIVRDAEKRITQATAQFANQVASINANAAKRAEEITKNFQESEAQAEAQYQENRANIIQEGGKAIQEIEEQHQERLRKMTQEHEERVEDLTASRDALGLAKEQRRFNQGQAEENRATRIEIAKRRADLAERLAELDQQHEAEKAQRLAQFQEQLAENEAQRQEQLKEAAAAHAEELRQIREQRAEQLRELQEGLNAERLRRREVFIEEIRDLDAALLGERELRARHYAQAIADAEAFFTAWRSKLPNATNVPGSPGFAVGGYASGFVRTGENGVEYILSNRTTRAAERLIGGGLTQDAVLRTLARGAGNSRSLTIGGNWRFDGRISSREVRAIKQAAIADIARELE